MCSYHPLLRSRWRLCCLTDAAHPLRVPLCQFRSGAAESPSTGALLNAASAAMPHSASSLPPSNRHSRLTIVRRGCKTVTNRRGSWRSHVHRTRLRSACSSSRLRLPMQTPFFWTGDARFLSTERKWGSHSCSAYGAASPRHKCRDPLRTCAENGVLYGLYNESHCQNPL